MVIIIIIVHCKVKHCAMHCRNYATHTKLYVLHYKVTADGVESLNVSKNISYKSAQKE